MKIEEILEKNIFQILAIFKFDLENMYIKSKEMFPNPNELEKRFLNYIEHLNFNTAIGAKSGEYFNPLDCNVLYSDRMIRRSDYKGNNLDNVKLADIVYLGDVYEECRNNWLILRERR